MATGSSQKPKAPLFVIEEPGEWQIEVYDDGAMKFIDYVEDVAEITFG